MRFTEKLLSYLNRVFMKDPEPFVALRINYEDGGLIWKVEDGVLTLTATGGIGTSHTIDLSAHTLTSLAEHVAAQDGYVLTYIDPTRAHLSARVLLDGEGDQDQSNGNRLLGYTSLLWAILESAAFEVQRASDQIREMIAQLTTKTAGGVWLDELGSYYAVPRLQGEADAAYGERIIAEAVRPLANNVALEMAIADYTGQAVEVVDVVVYRGVFPVYDGTIQHDGTYNYDTVGKPEYGLFDIRVGFDLEGADDPDEFLNTVRAIVERIRAAGTHLRALVLSGGSAMADTLTAPTDSGAGNTPRAVTLVPQEDTLTAPTDDTPALAVDIEDEVEAFAAPTDEAVGSVYRVLTDHTGAPITTDTGEPILASIGPLFE